MTTSLTVEQEVQLRQGFADLGYKLIADAPLTWTRGRRTLTVDIDDQGNPICTGVPTRKGGRRRTVPV